MRMGRKAPDAAHGAEKSRVAEASEADCYACRKAGREPVLSELPSGGFVCGLCHPNPHELATPAKFEDEEHSHEPVCEDAPHPRYQPGIYQARCIAAVVYRDPRFRRYVARLKLQLVPDGSIVFAFRNLGSGEKPVVKRGSEYRRDWIIAHGEQPRKRQTLSPRVFINKIFRVRIDDVKKRHDGREHPDAEVYSTVKEVIARLWP